MFFKIFDSMIPVIILKTCILKSSMLFGRHTLSKKVIKSIVTSNTPI